MQGADRAGPKPGRQLHPCRPARTRPPRGPAARPGHLPAAVRALPAARLRRCRPRCGRGPRRPRTFKVGGGPGTPCAGRASQWSREGLRSPTRARPAWLAFFREITLQKVHCDSRSGRLPGSAPGSGEARTRVPAGIPEGPRGRPPAQIKVRANSGDQMGKVRAVGVNGERQVAQMGSEVEMKAGMVWVQRSVPQTVGGSRS